MVCCSSVANVVYAFGVVYGEWVGEKRGMTQWMCCDAMDVKAKDWAGRKTVCRVGVLDRVGFDSVLVIEMD